MSVEAAAALREMASWHQPTSGMGFNGSGYGDVTPCCSTCGTPDEYAVPWPCGHISTIAAGLGVTVESLTTPSDVSS